MKLIATLIISLFIFSGCGQNNQSGGGSGGGGSEQNPIVGLPKILNVNSSRSQVEVVTDQSRFSIPVRNIRALDHSHDLVLVVYEDLGIRIKIYNSAGTVLYNGADVMNNPNISIANEVIAVAYLNHSYQPRLMSLNSQGARLINFIQADDVKIKIRDRLLMATYNDGAPRATAIRSNGQILVSASEVYPNARFSTQAQMLYLDYQGGNLRIEL